MSNATELGYKVGQRFRVIRGGGTVARGSVVELHKDDNTNSPWFTLISGHSDFSPDRFAVGLYQLEPLPERGETEVSDGSTASYYQLPEHATELYHLIIDRNMNAQLGEIFRAAYRYGRAGHSDQLRDIRKIKAYAIQEEERLLREAGEYVPTTE